MTQPWDELVSGDDRCAEVRHRGDASYLILRNEFATVWLHLEQTANGVRLRITDADARTSVALDPLELEAISRMSHGDFDRRVLERGAERSREQD